MFLPRGHNIEIRVEFGEGIEPISCEATIIEFLPHEKRLKLCCNDYDNYIYLMEVVSRKNRQDTDGEMFIECISGLDSVELEWCRTSINVVRQDFKKHHRTSISYEEECKAATILEASYWNTEDPQASIKSLTMKFEPQVRLKEGVQIILDE